MQIADPPRVQPGWELLLPDYTNVRGVNYVPIYPQLFDDPPDLPPPLTFQGTAGPVAMWRFYDHDTVDHQLTLLKHMGVNSLRMWCSYWVWEHEERNRGTGPNRFIERWSDFLELCEKHRLWVMPVFWDHLLTEPSAVPYDDLGIWARAPRQKDWTVQWAADPSNPFNGDAYVRAVVEASRRSTAIFMWDVANEPPFARAFLAHYCDRIREWDCDPGHPTTIGFAGQLEWVDDQLWNWPTHDVLSFHTYGLFRQNHEEWARMAFRVSRPPFTDRPKPVLATEGGLPNGHDKAIEYAREMGYGLMPFLGIIGDVRGKLPYRDVSGFLYHDGEARTGPEVRAYQQWAMSQGVIPGLLADLPEKQDLTGFQPPLFPRGFGVRELIRSLDPRAWPYRAKTTDFRDVRQQGRIYQDTREKMLHLRTSFGWLSSGGPGHPGFLLPEDQFKAALFGAIFTARDLVGGVAPWILPDGRPDLERYEEFFTEWGIEFWQIIRRNGLGV